MSKERSLSRRKNPRRRDAKPHKKQAAGTKGAARRSPRTPKTGEPDLRGGHRIEKVVDQILTEPDPRRRSRLMDKAVDDLLAEPGLAWPDDLIVVSVALSEYWASRATLKRARDDGRLKGYRPTQAAPNSPFQYSRAELDRFFRRRKNSRES